MKLASALEGGLAGASTLALLQEALHKIDHRSPRPFLPGVKPVKRWKKKAGKGKRTQLLIRLAGELVSGIAYFGLSGLGKKKNALLRGGLLGAGAGLGLAFLENDEPPAGRAQLSEAAKSEALRNKLVTVALYTAGGLLAGYALQEGRKKKAGRKRKR